MASSTNISAVQSIDGAESIHQFLKTYRGIEVVGQVRLAGRHKIEVELLKPFPGLRATKTHPFDSPHVPDFQGAYGRRWAEALLIRLYLVGRQVERESKEFRRLLGCYQQERTFYKALELNLEEERFRLASAWRVKGKPLDALNRLCRQDRQNRADVETCQSQLAWGIAENWFATRFKPRLTLGLLLSVADYVESRFLEEQGARA